MLPYDAEQARKTIALYDRLLQQRATTENMWQALADLLRPTRAYVRSRRAPGQQQTQFLFDGTGVKAAHDLAAALSGSMTSVDYQWFTLRMALEELNEDWETRQWLEECARRIYLAFQQSNFGSEIHEMYQDLIVFGTGCMWMDERPLKTSSFNGFIFRTIAPGRYVISEDEEGKPNIVGTELTMSAKAVAAKFGMRALSDKGRTLATERPEEPMKILRFIQPVKGLETNPRKQYELSFFELDQKHFLGGSYLRRLRCLVPRWEKASEEVYGRGRGHIAYPDVATLNRAVELRLRNWAKAVDPPILTVDDGVIGKIRLQSGMRTVVRNPDAIRPFETGTRFDVANFQEEQIRTAIRNYFFADQLQLPAKQYMTAYEIASHVELMQRLLAPTTGRLKDELFNPLIDYAFDAMMATGVLPPPPPLVVQAALSGYTDINVMYTSPLTRSQRANEVGAFQQMIAATQSLFAANPSLMDNFDADRIVREAGTNAGMPARWLTDPTVRDQQRAARAQQQAQLQALMMKDQAAKTAETMTRSAVNVAELPPDQGGGIPGG